MIDIIIILLLFLGFYVGYKRGLLKTLFSIISSILSYAISFILSSRLAFLLVEFIPLKEKLNYNNSNLPNLNISEAYYKVIIFFIVFFLIKYILRVIFRTLNVITKIPIIKVTNKIFGGLLGFLEIYIIIFVFIYLIYVLPLNEELRNMLSSSVLANNIFEKTPILSKMLLENFFYYK
ncbi:MULTISPECIES: CvpA family protein [unclassified Gemella]|uniref:CvpA family protein n=1 Tax=unclassified Gemella TaxID=2624949 RepID=UPI001C0540A1|nr:MULTISPECIES: CvpA family protein [unclassified Gemella]MBU0278496.1 CvpA family protein [Gemella sp. zg-1178]QWQ39465.1 CvpA family protein [Gemella sp. zg-570]